MTAFEELLREVAWQQSDFVSDTPEYAIALGRAMRTAFAAQLRAFEADGIESIDIRNYVLAAIDVASGLLAFACVMSHSEDQWDADIMAQWLVDVTTERIRQRIFV